nr:unnamed protein product [Callosobruchus analis]
MAQIYHAEPKTSPNSITLQICSPVQKRGIETHSDSQIHRQSIQYVLVSIKIFHKCPLVLYTHE